MARHARAGHTSAYTKDAPSVTLPEEGQFVKRKIEKARENPVPMAANRKKPEENRKNVGRTGEGTRGKTARK
jgi:type III secretion system FlhB-like substrate exporter